MLHTKILLIEDNSDDEFLALRTLARMGFTEITVARDGREAITALHGNDACGVPQMVETPGLILLDLRLPKLDGLEVLRKIRVREQTRDIPVFILTSSEDPHDKEVCRKLGAVGFLAKPPTTESLQAVLDNVTGRE